MLKYIMSVIILILFTGCLETPFKKNESINSYVNEKHGENLQRLNITEVKCIQTTDGKYSIVYYTEIVENGFPATIQIEKAQSRYIVYFDKGYLNMSKDRLLTDIDECMVELNIQSNNKKSWNNI